MHLFVGIIVGIIEKRNRHNVMWSDQRLVVIVDRSNDNNTNDNNTNDNNTNDNTP